MPTFASERRWLVLFVLCIAVFLVVVDNTIVNVALPTISRDLHASNSSLQWIVDGYSLPFAGLLLAGGALSDRWGRKRVMQYGALRVLGLLGAGGVLAQRDDALDRSRADGRQCGVHLPGHAVDADRRLRGPSRTGQGVRLLGRDDGHRDRARTDRRWRAHHALLLRVDLLGERAGRAHRRRRDRVGRAGVDESRTPSPGPGGTGARHDRRDRA